MAPEEMCRSCRHEAYCMAAYQKDHWCGNHTGKEGRYRMQKHEFEERIESTVSDEDYKLIEFVYQFHPVIRNVSGKDEVAELYKSFGMALFRDMEPRAKKAKEVEEKMTSCRLEIETLTELLATRKAEMKDLEAELQELRI